MIWFGLNQDAVGKFVFLAGAQIAVWLVYFLVCLVVHRLSLRSPEKRQSFLAKNHDEQGKELGSVIEGY
ncbi:hypothetical protein [Paraferrimonas haliotis]|uniref:hypothetical protein n=1 Tax=Paraferrimonas haliotis TaxID=2013866 RepID=UPI000BA9D150|nr:hypothetical protein [Paraferrimonas haliotis]